MQQPCPRIEKVTVLALPNVVRTGRGTPKEKHKFKTRSTDLQPRCTHLTLHVNMQTLNAMNCWRCIRQPTADGCRTPGTTGGPTDRTPTPKLRYRVHRSRTVLDIHHELYVLTDTLITNLQTAARLASQGSWNFRPWRYRRRRCGALLWPPPWRRPSVCPRTGSTAAIFVAFAMRLLHTTTAQFSTSKWWSKFDRFRPCRHSKTHVAKTLIIS